jgi:hypothetical protein
MTIVNRGSGDFQRPPFDFDRPIDETYLSMPIDKVGKEYPSRTMSGSSDKSGLDASFGIPRFEWKSRGRLGSPLSVTILQRECWQKLIVTDRSSNFGQRRLLPRPEWNPFDEQCEIFGKYGSFADSSIISTLKRQIRIRSHSQNLCSTGFQKTQWSITKIRNEHSHYLAERCSGNGHILIIHLRPFDL